MKRAGKVKWGELKVGIIIALAIAAMLYASFKGGGTSIFEQKNNYLCYFSDLDGLAIGSPVWLAGVEVGNVSNIDFLKEQREPGRNIEVHLRVKKSVAYLITPGTFAQISTIGLLGDKYAQLLPGPLSDSPLPNGSVIPSKSQAGLAGAITELPEIIDRINQLLASIERVLVSVDTAGGTIPMLIKDRGLAERVSSLVDKSSNLVTTLDKNASSMTRNIGTIADDFHALSEELLAGQGTLGQLLRDPAPFDNIVSTTARLDTLLRKVDSGEGTAGQLVNDQELYDNIKDLMARMNTLIKDLADNPKKYFKFSIF
jgi:phospholipid/cholesterol/gamma-HCH transport system substrate-binding protein